MSTQKDRLISLVEFAQQSARLRSKTPSTVTEHTLFSLYEHQMQGLPGIRVNVGGVESEDEVWLAVERLHEMAPASIANAVLRPWVQLTQGPTEEPRLREIADGAGLIAAGTHCSSAIPPVQGMPVVDPKEFVALSRFSRRRRHAQSL